MYEINMQPASEAFAQAWQSAGQHLEAQGQGAVNWLRAHLNPPFLEHLSFRLGNQLFFIRLEGDDLEAPGNRRGLFAVADGCQGHACVMPMQWHGRHWRPTATSWGLFDARSGRPLDPPALITDALIEMTDWEVHDFAVQVVRRALEKDGRELMSWVGDPNISPSIWFVGDQGPEWVVVRATRYPVNEATRPGNLSEIAGQCARMSTRGHFASVGLACMESMDQGNELWRGYGLIVRYRGLEPC